MRNDVFAFVAATFSSTRQNTSLRLNAITVTDDSPTCTLSCLFVYQCLSVYLHVPVSLFHTSRCTVHRKELNCIYSCVCTCGFDCTCPFTPNDFMSRCATDQSHHFIFSVSGRLDLWQFVENAQFLCKMLVCCQSDDFVDRLMLVYNWQKSVLGL